MRSLQVQGNTRRIVMTIKARIEKLERTVPEPAGHDTRMGNFADQLRQARLRAGLPEHSEALMERGPDRRKLSITERLDAARMRNRERLLLKHNEGGPEK
jgi:hypothetical protein